MKNDRIETKCVTLRTCPTCQNEYSDVGAKIDFDEIEMTGKCTWCGMAELDKAAGSNAFSSSLIHKKLWDAATKD